MRMRLKHLLGLAVLLLAVLLPPRRTQADQAATRLSRDEVVALIKQLQHADQDLKTAWAELSQVQQQAILAYITPATFKQHTTLERITQPNTPHVVSNQRTHAVAAYNGVGDYRTWTLYDRVTWCDDGTSVVSLTPSTWGDVGALSIGWTYKGKMSESLTPVPNYFAEHFVQGHFALCLWEVCAPHSYPWITMTVWPGGTYTPAGGF